MDKILVVIPYLASAAQGRELEFAVAGWKHHFIHPCHIVIVGEGLGNVPDSIVDNGGISFIESPRVPAIQGQYRQHLDYVNCLRKVREAFPEGEEFIFVADDCYAVNDFDLADVKFLKMQEPDLRFNAKSKNGWERDKAKTRDALIRDGYPTRNFTTHLPQCYNWARLETLWDRFKMDSESHVMEDLYYNIWHSCRIPFRLDRRRDNLKLGLYSKNPDLAELNRAMVTKIWITNSPEGWVPMLEDLLKAHYGI